MLGLALQRPARTAFAAVTAGAGIALAIMPADAAPARSKRAARTEISAVAAAPALPKQARPAVAPQPFVPPVAVVSLGAQTITLYSGTTVIASAPISSGMDGHRTPTGVFSIIQKNKYHESNIYSGAPMPFMQRLTWSGIAMHAGNLPGYRASHGCVRLPYSFAENLFSTTRMGARVVVTPDVVAPQAIAHARLPAPTMVADTMTASAPGLTLASTEPAAATVSRLLNPMQMAEVEKRRLAAAHLEIVHAAKAAFEAAGVAARLSDALQVERVAAERRIVTYTELLASARNLVAVTTGDDDKVQAEASVYAAEEAVADATAAASGARSAAGAAVAASFKSARAARDLEDAADAAEHAARLASRGTDPITVFVSRKEGKVMIRQGWQTILEGEVTFRDPQVPLGTHVLTAVAATAENTLQWTSVSVADGTVGRQSAASALERITIEPTFVAEIAKRLWTGATLIISDQGVSNETGKGTDFVILTK